MNGPIYLYGAPASGKTTLGKRLAAALGVEFIDLDAAIVEAAGCPIPQIFAEKGEPYFRDLEAETLKRVSSAMRIISLGGGSLLRASSREFAEANGAVLCIDTPSDDELSRRIGLAAGSRPLGNKAKERAPHYNSFPKRIARWFELEDSLVVVGTGFAAEIIGGEKIVADATVAKLYPQLNSITTIPSGEEYKTISTVVSLWSAFAKAGLGRKNRVVALGGGVTGDLTGFAAATWMRGIPWINVPTTLLSMVDASTGGKTGCDLPEGKNLAGAFHAPKLVVVDTEFLNTLPPEIIRQGKAEMIKHAAIGGQGVGEDGEVDRGTIADNLAVKVGIVWEDPLETKGKRILLNCGHTIGHAIEKLSNYTLAHGEAVAIGCVEEARLAVKLGLASAGWPSEFAACFAAVGLPTALPEGMTWERLVPVMKGDKKRSGDTVTFTLPCGWGDVRAVPIDLSK